MKLPVVVVLFSVGITLVASYLHHRYVLGVERVSYVHYIVPFFVGLLFGILLSALIKLYWVLLEKEEKLERLSLTDDLTGLPNRRGVMSFLEFEISKSKRYEEPLSVALLDLDDFKAINDTYGHLVGDTVLREFAALMRSKLRASDIVGRWGGEEFLVIMPNTDLRTAVGVIERLRKEVSERYFDLVGRLSVSAGVAELREEDDTASIIRRADENLYRAKREGKDRVISS